MRRWLLGMAGGMVLMMLLTACAGGFRQAPTAVPTLVRLPTVTPIPTPAPAPTRRELVQSIATAQPTPQPTATPVPVQTGDGFVTGSMARLGLGGELYATMGDPAAPITVVEFADFGCEFCRLFHLMTFPLLKAEYIDTGKVFYVFKDLPVVSVQGGPAAQAAECAGEQGYYWQVHNQLFSEPEAWNAGEAAAFATFRAAITEAGGDAAALEACIRQERYRANVDRNVQEAHKLRIFGTPAFFINARLLSGAQSIELWRELLDGER